MKKILLLIFILVSSISGAFAQTLNAGGVVNKYTKVKDIITNCRIRVNDPLQYSIGEQVVIMQMKGVDLVKQNNSSFGDIASIGPGGLFEFNYIDSIFGDTIDLVYQLRSADYNVNTRLQMISLPTADVLNVVGTIVAPPWNGTTGGVVILNARDSIVLASDIDVNGQGFRGGVRSSANFTCARMDYSYGTFVTPFHGAYKGESYALIDGNHITGRGAWGIGGGGGNNHNTGGGGGGNSSSGGLGGKQSFVNTTNQGCNDTVTVNGGIGGKAFNYNNYKERVFFGGGGGGGHQNDLPSAGGGEAGSGGAGGGIVILVTPHIFSYNRNIFANGTSQDSIAGRDGGGGGGAGGSILLYTQSIRGTLNIQVKGGKGADNNSHNNLSFNLTATHGTGGGGSGGYLGYSAGSTFSNISAVMTGGLNGKILNSGSFNYDGAYGATEGGNGSSVFGLVLPRGGNFCKPTIIDAAPDQSQVTKNTPKTVLVKKNDLLNRKVRVSICKQPVNGKAQVINFDSITYTPTTSYVGKDSLLYCVCTLLEPPTCDSAWVIFTITEVQVKAIDDVALTYFETAVQIPVLSNDSLNVPVTAALSNPALFGMAVWNGSIFTYTPAPGFVGRDSFTYTICSSTTPVVCDTATVVVEVKIGVQLYDDFADVEMNTGTFIYPRRNDIVNVPAVLSVYEFPKNGSIVIQNGDSIFYTPNTNFFGYDTLKYQVCAYNPIAVCDSAVVYIRVVPQVRATNDAYSLYINRSVRSRVLSNDTVFGGYTTSLLRLPSKGVAVMQGDSIFFQSGLYYKGNDTLTYTVCSNLIPGYCDTARVVYTTKSSIFTQDDAGTTFEDIPLTIFVKQNDTEFEPSEPIVMINPRHGSTAIIGTDSIRYLPGPDYNGIDSFRYALCTIGKPSICDTSWVRLTIIPQNDAPLATFDTATTYRNKGRLIDVLPNDRDPDGDPLSIYLVDQPINGTVKIDGTQLFYTPISNYIGTDRFRYAVCDNAQPALCDTTDVFITILDRVELVISKGLTPNMDGINDTWVVGNLELASGNEVLILNRWGNVVWKTDNYQSDWTGVNMQGEPLPEGTYFYVIRIPQEGRVYKGFIIIERQ